VVPDPINGAQSIRDLYLLAQPNYTGRFSVPVLWDKKAGTIVSNESSEIIRMFATEFDDLLDEEHRTIKIVPEDLRENIDTVNGWIYVRLTSPSPFSPFNIAYQCLRLARTT
jgi:glutathionyl-hydroquinone reductase